MLNFETDINITYQQAGSRIEEKVIMTAYLLDTTPEISVLEARPAVIICPGGGYEFRSRREAEPIAMKYLAEGIHAFILEYSVSPSKWPCAMLELAKAVQTVREHAAQWRIDPKKIIISGFSAGGHLATSLGTLWDEQLIVDALGANIIEGEKAWKPDGMVLCYPVITMGEYTHQGSRNALLGKDLTEEEYEKLSFEKRVTEKTVPAFLWHTQEDGAVPVENSLNYALALRKSKVPFELHVFEKGGHGLSLCNELTSHHKEQLVVNNQSWIDLAIRWIKQL